MRAENCVHFALISSAPTLVVYLLIKDRLFLWIYGIIRATFYLAPSLPRNMVRCCRREACSYDLAPLTTPIRNKDFVSYRKYHHAIWRQTAV